jgi:hypothetical protein
VMNMEIELIGGFMVLSLFLGYLALWRLKKRKMLRHNGDNPEVMYDDNCIKFLISRYHG